MVNGSVAADEPGTIQQQPHGEPLQRNLLERLIEGPLHERGVHGEERLESGLGQPRHHVQRVALADARIE